MKDELGLGYCGLVCGLCSGVIYHYPNSHLGDYDLESEEAIYHLILKGK